MKTPSISTILRLGALLSVTAFLCACVATAETASSSTGSNSFAARAGGLSCFSAVLSASAENEKPQAGTCDEVCAARDAACVGATLDNRELILPLPNCGSPPPAGSSSLALACRCCRGSQ